MQVETRESEQDRRSPRIPLLGRLASGLLVVGYTLSLTFVAAILLPTSAVPTKTAPRSAHEAQIARQQLVDQQIAAVDAALAAEQASVARAE